MGLGSKLKGAIKKGLKVIKNSMTFKMFRDWKGYVRDWEKFLKATDPMLFKILDKLGLRGKHITHTYLMVQPLHEGYMPDPIKTLTAQAIAENVPNIPEYLTSALRQDAGIKLMQYYHFSRIRIKKYNFRSGSTIVVADDPLTPDEMDEIIKEFIPDSQEFTNYYVSAYSIEPTAMGGYLAYIEDTFSLPQDELDARMVRQVIPANVNYDSLIFSMNDVSLHEMEIAGQQITALQIGIFNFETIDENGSPELKTYPVYVGAVNLRRIYNKEFIYIYDPNVISYLDKAYSYMLVFIPRFYEETDVNETVENNYQGTESDGITENNVTVSATSDVIQWLNTRIEIKTENNVRTRTVRKALRIALGSDLSNMDLIYGNETVSMPAGFYQKMHTKSAPSDPASNQESASKLFRFFPALPLKRNSKHTIKFKDGDPYAGTYDPNKEQEKLKERADALRKRSGFGSNRNYTYPQGKDAYDKAVKKYEKAAQTNQQNNDSEIQRPPRSRNITPKGYTKPRTIKRRLRRKVNNIIVSAERRKYEVAAKFLNENYEALVGQLIHSEKQSSDNPEVHHSYILPSVCLNSKVMEVKEYWFKFFDRIYERMHKGKPTENVFNIQQSVLDNLATNWFTKHYGEKGYEEVGSMTARADTEIPLRHVLLKPKQITISALTENNKVDTLLFNLSYVGITKFKIKGEPIKKKKKRRHRNYYDIRMGSFAKEPTLVVPLEIKHSKGTKTQKGKQIGNVKVGLVNESNFKFITTMQKTLHDTFDPNSSLRRLVNNVSSRGTYADPDVYTYACFCKQVGDDEIEIIAVQGLNMINTVHDKGIGISAHKYLLNYNKLKDDGYINMFVMPICYKTLRYAGLVSNTRFAARSVQRLDYSTKDEYKPWYSRSAFKVVLTIVQIVLFIITIYFGGVGAALVEAAKQGALAVIKQILINIAISIAIQVAVQAVVKMLAKVFGAEFAAILGAIAAVVMTAYGMSNSMGLDLPFASQVMMVAPAIVGGATSALADMQANVQNMMVEEKQKYEKAMEGLEEDKKHLEEYVSSGIDPQAFVMALNNRVENMESFFMRTLETNLNKFADLDYLADSLETSLSINYEPSLETNWTGVPTHSEAPEDWEDLLPENLKEGKS